MHFEFGQNRLTQPHALSPLELAPGRGHKPSQRFSGLTRFRAVARRVLPCPLVLRNVQVIPGLESSFRSACRSIGLNRRTDSRRKRCQVPILVH